MNKHFGALALASALIATGASAQDGLNLTGQFQCIALCVGPPGGVAFVTQFGWDLNFVNDAGMAYRGWLDRPGRIWVDWANVGAVYSPDGVFIQFDNGTVWRRLP